MPLSGTHRPLCIKKSKSIHDTQEAFPDIFMSLRPEYRQGKHGEQEK